MGIWDITSFKKGAGTRRHAFSRYSIAAIVGLVVLAAPPVFAAEECGSGAGHATVTCTSKTYHQGIIYNVELSLNINVVGGTTGSPTTIVVGRGRKVPPSGTGFPQSGSGVDLYNGVGSKVTLTVRSGTVFKMGGDATTATGSIISAINFSFTAGDTDAFMRTTVESGVRMGTKADPIRDLKGDLNGVGIRAILYMHGSKRRENPGPIVIDSGANIYAATYGIWAENRDRNRVEVSHSGTILTDRYGIWAPRRSPCHRLS